MPYRLSEDAETPGFCRFLPPFFRQHWMKWVEETAVRQLEAAYTSVEHRVKFMRRLKLRKPRLRRLRLRRLRLRRLMLRRLRLRRLRPRRLS